MKINKSTINKKVGSNLAVSQAPFFLLAPTQNFQDLEKACSRDHKADEDYGGPKGLSFL